MSRKIKGATLAMALLGASFSVASAQQVLINGAPHPGRPMTLRVVNLQAFSTRAVKVS